MLNQEAKKTKPLHLNCSDQHPHNVGLLESEIWVFEDSSPPELSAVIDSPAGNECSDRNLNVDVNVERWFFEHECDLVGSPGLMASLEVSFAKEKNTLNWNLVYRGDGGCFTVVLH